MDPAPANGPATATIEHAWRVLGSVPDPEIPAVSVVELGIVREIGAGADGALVVVLTPTYAGCPATATIEADVRAALVAAGATRVEIRTRLAPAWSSDWIAPAARERLRAAGIAPPGPAAGAAAERPLRFVPPPLPCPRCGATDTERLSAFGSTPCKALHRCRACREPFEAFKPH